MSDISNADAQPGQPDAAAAAEGAQGQGATQGEGLYNEVLNAIPEQFREQVEPHLKKWDANVTKMRQEDVEFRQGWEPLSQIEGLRDIPPDALEQLVQFHGVAQDEDAFADFLIREAEARGLIDPEDDDGEDPDGDPGDGDVPELDFSDPQTFMQSLSEHLQESVSGMLDERLKPLEERFSAQDEEQRVTEANNAIGEALEGLKSEHGEFNEERVLRLALGHAKDGVLGPDAIKAGFDELQAIVAESEQGMFARKAEQPQTPEQGGRPASTKERPTTFKGARDAALAMARSSSA